MAKFQTIKDWYPILKWPELPNFGDCHHIVNYGKFLKHYYVCDELRKLEVSISEALKIDRKSNFRLLGPAGSGKTSFVYYLLKKSYYSKTDIFNKHYCYVFHTNKADHKDYKNLIRFEILRGLKGFFETCGFQDEFNRINAYNHSSKKEKINTLIAFYKDKREKFDKKYLFIIDDVDLLSNDEMTYNIAETILKDLELKSITKVINIRNSTYQRYGRKLKNLLEEFFPTPYSMPDTHLYKIEKHRIYKLTKKNGKVPFSESLCGMMNLLFDGNKRQALGILGSIIENTLPKKIRTTESEEFIGNYIENNSISTLIDNNSLPNLHLEYYRSSMIYPVPTDIMLSLLHTSNKSIIFGALNDMALRRSRNSKLSSEAQIIKLTLSEFEYSIKTLINESLIYDNNKNVLKLTNKGKILCRYISRKFYHHKCKKLLPPLDINATYWNLLKRPINHETILTTFQTWRDAHSVADS